MSEHVKRPTATETDDDLLKMQEEWEAANKKPSVEIHKMKNRQKVEEVASLPSKVVRDQAARFQIDFDEEQAASGVLFPVKERNFAERSEILAENLQKFQLYSKDDGFPEPLDLSAYFSAENPKTLTNLGGKSFFAAEFDRINGNLAENLDFKQETTENPSGSDDFQAENEKYLKSLDFEKIQEMKLEITERFDPKLLEFLKNRGNKASEETQKKPKKISKFKASRQQKEPENEQKGAPEPPAQAPPTKVVEEMMNELEVLEEYGNREDQEKYNRLATDAVQLDLTAKFGRNLVSRQQKNAVKLFDNCKLRPETSAGSTPDPILELARSSIDQIKTLYLEEIATDSSSKSIIYEFGKGLNPILDNCWTLIPVRRVLDAVERRHGTVTPDDVEIVRLSLLWTLLLFSERKSAFFAFAEPNEFYVHIAEVFLIGAEILADDVIAECAHRILNGYILAAAKDAKIGLRMSGKVAGLDAFMPFYENLLKNYEQYSMGDEHFAMTILIAAYLNSPVGDSIEYRFALWSPKRNTIRQMTLSTSSQSCRDLLGAIKTQILERETVIYEQHYVQYCSLLGAYVTAIRDDLITRERNQMMFEIAAFEIGKFLEKQKNDTGKQKEFQILVEIIRKSIGEKLNF
ncbi:RNA polymerase II-associated protein 1 N-terminal domain-containing protein [Caenorhabditis elegans]|uniref:RNA polymerase II-associated protein 1 N-terminal domain-containing protein n=2 Tax=Caenorhabditis elegans TaxID=6239 RepID=H2L086_CAEEL|nr:RNA polymerase II-associated protein 1 N-terminal domain-containing protein [Caenorhabditis elegans]CCD71951.1 RNA polymerase II-associated protein 1 N-terminal domain-containing protein [Caenorhabditis elegans]|eukprot:NP_001023231.2 Uncharacterized protein CELE_F56B3.4 [Caenorhabditis elegans]